MTTAILEGMAQKRPKELRGKRGAHEAHNKTEELPRTSQKNIICCCILHPSTHWQEPAMCYWQKLSLESKNKERTEREKAFTILFPTVLTIILLFSTFSVKPSNRKSHSSSSALQQLNFCCALPVSWPLVQPASCPLLVTGRARRNNGAWWGKD